MREGSGLVVFVARNGELRSEGVDSGLQVQAFPLHLGVTEEKILQRRGTVIEYIFI